MYLRYGPMVHRRCRRLLGDDEEATDAMHDVFMQMVRRQPSRTVQAPGALLYTVATHVCLNRLRTRRRHPETREEALLNLIATTDDLEAQTQQRSLLTQIFAREPASTRLIAVLHYVDRMTLQEVAKTVNMSVSGVRKRLRNLQARVQALQEGFK